MTAITFSEPEMDILQKGLKYNIHSKPKEWRQTLAFQAETAITHLSPSEREVYRKLTPERISILKENNKFPRTHNTQSEPKIIRSIKTKLTDSRAMITGVE